MQKLDIAPLRQMRTLNAPLWISQGGIALIFVGGGVWKLTTPIKDLAEKFPWAGDLAPGWVRSTAALDILGGLGVLLPSVTRVKPDVTVLAALGCAALMIAAVSFHLSRGEAADTPFNLVLATASLFVAWGRHSKRPIQTRVKSR